MAKRIIDLDLKSKSESVANERLVVQNTKTQRSSSYQLADIFPILQDGGTTSGSKSLGSALGTSTVTSLFVGGGFGNSLTGNENNTLIFKGVRSNDTVLEIKNETLSSDVTKTNLVLDFNQSNLDLSACNNTSSGFLSQATLSNTNHVTGTLPVANGGTGATVFADKSVIISQDSGTDTLSAVAMSTNGQILIGGTSGPAVGTLTAGTNITITNSDGGISIASAIGTISSTLDLDNNNIDLGTGFLSGDGSAEGVRLDSTGKVFIGSSTPTAYFTNDLNINSSISLGPTDGSTAQKISMNACTSGSSPALTISGSSASGTGNAGGNVLLKAGAGDSNGNGGDTEIHGGLRAGSGTDGSVVIKTGASGTITTAVTVDGSQNTTFSGGIVQRGDAGIVLHQNAPATTDDGTTVVSAANVLTGIVTCTPTADRSKATDTAANFISTLGLTTDDDAFDFSVINLATDGTSFITFTGGTGVTLVGSAIVSAQDNAEDAFTSGVGRFRIRRTGSSAVTMYRIA
tara:strand:+ start:6796 stop:8346 length:1551 start_codon:yes stop_codon:yes gene_type:complete